MTTLLCMLARTHSPTLGSKTSNINVKKLNQFKTHCDDVTPLNQQKSFG